MSASKAKQSNNARRRRDTDPREANVREINDGSLSAMPKPSVKDCELGTDDPEKAQKSIDAKYDGLKQKKALQKQRKVCCKVACMPKKYS